MQSVHDTWPDEPCQKKVELNQNTNHAFSVRLLSSECMGTSRNYIDINISDDMWSICGRQHTISRKIENGTFSVNADMLSSMVLRLLLRVKVAWKGMWCRSLALQGKEYPLLFTGALVGGWTWVRGQRPRGRLGDTQRTDLTPVPQVSHSYCM
jgi:hypothetical protein